MSPQQPDLLLGVFPRASSGKAAVLIHACPEGSVFVGKAADQDLLMTRHPPGLGTRLCQHLGRGGLAGCAVAEGLHLFVCSGAELGLDAGGFIHLSCRCALRIAALICSQLLVSSRRTGRVLLSRVRSEGAMCVHAW